MTTLEQRLTEIGYNDSPLRRDVINTVKEWIYQKPSKTGQEITDYLKSNSDYECPKKTEWIKKDELLEELEKKKQ